MREPHKNAAQAFRLLLRADPREINAGFGRDVAAPEILLDTARCDVAECVATCIENLRGRGVIA